MFLTAELCLRVPLEEPDPVVWPRLLRQVPVELDPPELGVPEQRVGDHRVDRKVDVQLGGAAAQRAGAYCNGM